MSGEDRFAASLGGNPPLDVSPGAIRDHLAHILASRPFAGSDRLKRFLEFVVEQALAGDSHQLKEYVIGTQVYDRGESFDPRTDGIVRTEANRLRTRLEEYYQSAGHKDAIRIEIPKGGYVPAFRVASVTDVVEPGGQPALGETSESTPVEAAASRGSRWRRSARSWLPGFALAVVLLTAAGWRYRNEFSSPPFAERDWLLIADFENRTGEQLLSGTLELTMEVEVSRSQFVNVAPRERVYDTLRLMKRPLDVPLPSDVAREVALRDGGIPVVLAGTITKAGRTYTASLRLIDVATGGSFAMRAQDATTPDALLVSVRRAAPWVRRSLGERGIKPPSGDSLEPGITTRSLQALRFFSQGMAEVNRRQWAPAEALLKQAVADDSEFATAHIYLMFAVMNQRKPEAEWRRHLARARELAPQVSERERLFILGATHHLERDHPAAIAFYEALLRKYPNEFWACNNLVFLLRDPKQLLLYKQRLADMRPQDWTVNATAAWAVARNERSLVKADRFLARLRKLAPSSGAAYELELFSAFEAWMREDLASVRETLKHIIDGWRPSGGFSDENVMLMPIGLGMLTFVEGDIRRSGNQLSFHRWMPWAAEARGDMKAFRRHATGLTTKAGPNALSAIVLVRAGYLDEAREMIVRGGDRVAKLDERRSLGVWQVARGELALALGRVDEAAALLEDAQRLLVPALALPETFIGAESLERLLGQRGQVEKGRDILRTVVSERAAAFGYPLYFWVRCAKRLAAIERRLGNLDAATTLERQLDDLLADADPDFRPDLDPLPLRAGAGRRRTPQGGHSR